MTDEQLEAIFALGNAVSTKAALRAVFDAGRLGIKGEIKIPLTEKESRMKFEIYKSKKEFRWRLVAGNGEIIARGEGYKNKADVVSVIDLLKSTNDAVPTIDKTVKK